MASMFSRYNVTDEMDLELAVERLGALLDTPAQNEGAEAGSGAPTGGL